MLFFKTYFLTHLFLAILAVFTDLQIELVRNFDYKSRKMSLTKFIFNLMIIFYLNLKRLQDSFPEFQAEWLVPFYEGYISY